MNRFSTEREAKEFLVGEIVRQAERHDQPLTDVERKMLYFSESSWTLPDMDDVAEAFDREYDSAKYERKIAKLARAARRSAETDKSAWPEAIERLEEGDHYLLVMTGRAGGRRAGAMTWPRVAAVLLMLTALAVALPALRAVFVRHFGYVRGRDALGFFLWAAGAAIVAAYLAVRLVVGAEAVDGWLDRRVYGWLDRVLERVVRAQRR
jgi:hypothetical protein